MDLLLAAMTVLMIAMGSMLSFRGRDVIRGFVRLTGGIFLGGVGLFLGFEIGSFFGGDWRLIHGLSLALLGATVGILFAPKLLRLALSITIFTLGGVLGWCIARDLGGGGFVPILSGVIAGLILSWFLSSLARKLLVTAVTVLGAAMVSTGSFLLLRGDISLADDVIISMVTFAVVSLIGFIIQRYES